MGFWHAGRSGAGAQSERCRRAMRRGGYFGAASSSHHTLAKILVFAAPFEGKEKAMEGVEYARKLKELDRLFNDPDAPMEPARLWRLLAELARHDGIGLTTRQSISKDC